jgi:hypothetical protein
LCLCFELFSSDCTDSSEHTGPGKASAEHILTDGCSFMNEAAFAIIARMNGFRPTAVQGRIRGSKGMWILDPEDRSPEPRIWLRTSQIKIKYKSPLQRSQRIFDLVDSARPSSSVSLSAQSIINLHFNGVPRETLIHLMEQGLREELEPLLKWEGPHALRCLWDVVAKLGGIAKSRAVREAGAFGRAKGLKRRERGNEDGDQSDNDEAQEEAEALVGSSGRNPYSHGE